MGYGFIGVHSLKNNIIREKIVKIYGFFERIGNIGKKGSKIDKRIIYWNDTFYTI